MAGKKGLLPGSQGRSPEGTTATSLALAARRQVLVRPSPRACWQRTDATRRLWSSERPHGSLRRSDPPCLFPT